MASSGTAWGNVAAASGSYAAGVRLRLDWKQISQDQVANSTKIRLTLYVVSGVYGHMIGTAPQTWSISCNGQKSNGSFTIQQGDNVTRQLGTLDVTISHNSNGDATFSASATASFNMDFNGWVESKSVSLRGTLNHISRASICSVSGTLQMGSEITIKTNRNNSSWTHTVKYNFQGHQAVIAEDVGASCKWTPDLATFAGWLPNATSAKCTIICNTYSGSTLIGTTETSFTLKVPNSVVPKFTSSTVTDAKGYATKYGGYILGMSDVRVTAQAESQYGATIKSITAELDGATDSGNKASFVLGAPTVVGSRSVKLTATDSRGRKITGTKAITVVDYDATLRANADVDRWNEEADIAEDESTTVRVHLEGSFFDVGGSGANTGTALVQYMQGTTGTEWTTAQTVQLENAFNTNVFIDGFAETQNFMFMITFEDSFGSTAQVFGFAGSATPVLDIRQDGSGLGIFTTADFDGLKVGNQMYIMPAAGNMYSSIYGQGSTDEPREALQLYRDRSVRALGDLFIGEAGYGYGTNLWMVPENGAPRQILNVDKDGYFNLYWRNGKGVGGMVMKTIWEGTWWTGEMTISQQMDYNLFVIKCNDRDVNLIGIRRNFGGSGSRITCFAVYSISTVGNHYTYAFPIMSTSATTWNIQGASYYQRHDNGGNHGSRMQIAITEVVGVL